MTIADFPTISCVIDWPGTFSVIKDIIVSTGTIFAIYAGVRGFKQWRAIEWAKAEFDVGRNLLKSVFNTRDWLNNARRPMIFGGEFPDSYDYSNATPQQKRDAHAHMFENRFKPVRDSAIELQSVRLEAEALWGGEIVKLTDDFLKCVRSLENAMTIYIRLAGTPEHPGSEQQLAQFEQIVFDYPRYDNLDSTKGGENPAKFEIREAVDRIEKYVRDKQRSSLNWIRS